jgi:hypothetical protein
MAFTKPIYVLEIFPLAILKNLEVNPDNRTGVNLSQIKIHNCSRKSLVSTFYELTQRNFLKMLDFAILDPEGSSCLNLQRKKSYIYCATVSTVPYSIKRRK